MILLLALFNILSHAQLLPPEVGAYHGAYADFGPMASDVTAERIQEFEKLAKKKIVWAYFANDWIDVDVQFPQKNVDECIKAGVIPYIRLMPWSEAVSQAKGKDPYFSMDQILNGDIDEALRIYAQKTKNSGTHVMFEFGPEVNGDWFPWNGKWNGGSTTNKYGDPLWPDGPEKFKDAFIRVVKIFREEGALNTTWVIHYDTAGTPNSPWNDAKYYYPGDEYVDWIGLSVFGAQLPNHEWLNFMSKLKNFESDINAVSTTKPLIISEFAVIEDKNDGQKKAKWIKQALQSIEKGLFKRVKGISYWNSPGWLENGKASFKIDTSDAALKTYQDEISSPFWLTEGILNETK